MTNWLARAKQEFVQDGESSHTGTNIKDDGNFITASTTSCTSSKLDLRATYQAANDTPKSEHVRSMHAQERAQLEQWLAHIGETDQAAIAHFLALCQRHPSDKQFFLAKAKRDLPSAAIEDERRTCQQCANLTPRGICLAAHRGEIGASRSYSPLTTIPMRCKGYAPGRADRDKRSGNDQRKTDGFAG